MKSLFSVLIVSLITFGTSVDAFAEEPKSPTPSPQSGQQQDDKKQSPEQTPAPQAGLPTPQPTPPGK